METEKALPFRWMGAADLHEKNPPIDHLREASIEIINQFISTIPGIRKLLVEDVKAAYQGDPAALSYAEVKLAYPGLVAITSHRIAHELYKLDVPLLTTPNALYEMEDWLKPLDAGKIGAHARGDCIYPRRQLFGDN